jgi:hypothetical protein
MKIVYSIFIGIIVGMIVGMIVGIGLQCRRDMKYNFLYLENLVKHNNHNHSIIDFFLFS